jgi:hypothetical protein
MSYLKTLQTLELKCPGYAGAREANTDMEFTLWGFLWYTNLRWDQRFLISK